MAAVQRPQRPKLPSLGAYAPQAQQESYAGGLLASCRALHSILGGGHATLSQQPDANLTMGHSLSASPFAPQRRQLQSPPRLVRPPRGINKRRRDEYEEDQQNKENIPQSPGGRDAYQTPKRQRRIPLDMPLGLNASDFASLATPASVYIPAPTTPRRDRDEDIQMPPFSATEDDSYFRGANTSHSTYVTCKQSPCKTRTGWFPESIQRQRQSSPSIPLSNLGISVDETTPSDDTSQEQWSPLDDRRLVEVVLSKLNLSRRDWNDCAKQLGKDKDSLGRRWKMLIGEGNVGLRRGLGRHERGDLDITSW